MWNPPFLEFSIERHGQTVKGSTRATVHTWRLDLEALTASITSEKPRQLRSMDTRLDVGPIAASIAEAIVNRRADPRLKPMVDGNIEIDIAQIIPETGKETTAGRRKRFRGRLNALLQPHGWRSVRPNVYAQET